MTKNEVKNLLNTIENDITVFEWNDVIRVTISDIEGFDPVTWEEVYRDYDEVKVDSVIDTLTKNAKEVVTDLYITLGFDGFKVIIGYESFDI